MQIIKEHLVYLFLYRDAFCINKAANYRTHKIDMEQGKS